MTIKPAIRTITEIDKLIYSPTFNGGWRKRVNLKRKLIEANNNLLVIEINKIKDEIHRRQKVESARAEDVREMWASVTKLELKIIS